MTASRDFHRSKIAAVRLAIAVAALALPAGAAAAADWGHLYGYVDWTSDYRFCGASESDRHSVMQGGLHWSMPDDFYAGVFVTGVDYRDYRNTSYETDWYGGRHFYFGASDLNLEALYSLTPDTAGHPTYTAPGTIYPGYNFFEAAAELTHAFGALTLAGKVLVEPRPQSHGGFLWSLNATAAYAVKDWLKASANAGHQETARTGSLHWDIGATATWRQQWEFDLRYYGTDISVADCYGMNWCKPAVVAKIKYSFVVL